MTYGISFVFRLICYHDYNHVPVAAINSLLEMTESHVAERSWQQYVPGCSNGRVVAMVRVYQCPNPLYTMFIQEMIENKTRTRLHANAEGYRCLQSRGIVRPQAPNVAYYARTHRFGRQDDNGFFLTSSFCLCTSSCWRTSSWRNLSFSRYSG